MDTLIFHSKIDWWLGLLLLSLTIMFVLFPLWEWKYNNERSIKSKVFVTIFMWSLALLTPLSFNIEYRLTNTQLLIETGLRKTQIELKDITEITPSRNSVSSPALSLDRLKVQYGDKSILISPRDKDAFIEAVKQRQLLLDKSNSGEILIEDP